MKIKRSIIKSPTIPISSMSDIAFLLLIFIMLLSLINYRREVKIEYPEATNYEVTQADSNLELWIDKDGDIYYKGNKISLQSAEYIISEAIIKKPTVRIHILADKRTKYKNINGVMNILKTLQHRSVSLVIKDR